MPAESTQLGILPAVALGSQAGPAGEGLQTNPPGHVETSFGLHEAMGLQTPRSPPASHRSPVGQPVGSPTSQSFPPQLHPTAKLHKRSTPAALIQEVILGVLSFFKLGHHSKRTFAA
jgi:hypothetical protein